MTQKDIKRFYRAYEEIEKLNDTLQTSVVLGCNIGQYTSMKAIANHLHSSYRTLDTNLTIYPDKDLKSFGKFAMTSSIISMNMSNMLKSVLNYETDADKTTVVSHVYNTVIELSVLLTELVKENGGKASLTTEIAIPTVFKKIV
jgi:hypothetical protein